MTVTTGLSGNEIYCLAQKGYTPGDLIIGNSVYALGVIQSINSGIHAMIGGEVEGITALIKDGREAAFSRLMQESEGQIAAGVTGVTSQVIFNSGTLEFLSIGSVIHGNKGERTFTTSADGQELYGQLDAGYQPLSFAFGNVAYSMGIGGGLLGGLKTFAKGEIREFSDVFNKTRHMALNRIVEHAKTDKANAVLGIQTTILPFGGLMEMLMVGTGSYHAGLASAMPGQIVTSDMTNIEMWNMAKLGYAPLKLLLGTSVYSLGFIGGISAALKSFVRGEINELTRMIYDARENAIGIIKDEARFLGADDVIGIKTYVYQLGRGGLIEFLAIGTAVKKMDFVKTESEQLPPQAIVVDRKTFVNAAAQSVSEDLNAGNKPRNRFSVVAFVIVIIWVVLAMIGPHHGR